MKYRRYYIAKGTNKSVRWHPEYFQRFCFSRRNFPSQNFLNSSKQKKEIKNQRFKWFLFSIYFNRSVPLVLRSFSEIADSRTWFLFFFAVDVELWHLTIFSFFLWNRRVCAHWPRIICCMSVTIESTRGQYLFGCCFLFCYCCFPYFRSLRDLLNSKIDKKWHQKKSRFNRKGRVKTSNGLFATCFIVAF